MNPTEDTYMIVAAALSSALPVSALLTATSCASSQRDQLRSLLRGVGVLHPSLRCCSLYLAYGAPFFACGFRGA